MAKGEIIATTDADTIVPPNWLSRIVQEFEADEKLAAFGGLYFLNSGSLLARVAVAYLTYPLFLLDKVTTRGWSIPGANLAIRRSAFVKIGGFNERLKLGEDADISHRLLAVGKVVLDPNFRVITSGRRFRHGIFPAILTYAPNVISRIVMRKNKFNKLSTVRDERSLLQRFSWLAMPFSILFLLNLFALQNPKVAEAKPIETTYEKIASVKKDASVEKIEFSQSIKKWRHRLPRANFFDRSTNEKHQPKYENNLPHV